MGDMETVVTCRHADVLVSAAQNEQKLNASWGMETRVCGRRLLRENAGAIHIMMYDRTEYGVTDFTKPYRAAQRPDSNITVHNDVIEGVREPKYVTIILCNNMKNNVT